MLFAIKLLLAVSVLSYAVSMVLADHDFSAFQPPISHFLGRDTGSREDFLTLKVRGGVSWRRGVNMAGPRFAPAFHDILPGSDHVVSTLCRCRFVCRRAALRVRSTRRKRCWRGASGIDKSTRRS